MCLPHRSASHELTWVEFSSDGRIATDAWKKDQRRKRGESYFLGSLTDQLLRRFNSAEESEKWIIGLKPATFWRRSGPAEHECRVNNARLKQATVKNIALSGGDRH
jgi:hypothetical protein